MGGGGAQQWNTHTCQLSLSALLLCAVAFLVANVQAVYIATLPCGSTVPIDSQFIFDPIWSISPHRNRIRESSKANLEVKKESVPRALRSIIKTESGMDPNSVTLFRLTPSPMGILSANVRNTDVAVTEKSSRSGDGSGHDSGNGGASGSALQEESERCTVTLDPLQAALAGVRSTGARLVFLEIGDSVKGGCAKHIEVNFTQVKGTTSLILSRTPLSTSSPPLTQSFSLGSGGSSESEDVEWPATLSFPSSCELQVLLLTNRHGRIDVWFAWIPTTVYTAVVTALIIPALFVNRHMPTGLVALEIVVVFLGYLGACIGLIVELICWQSSLGRMFPFPSSVTLYTCLIVLYALYLLPLVYRHQGNYRILLMGVLRMLVYGLNCALCVGYWISGYVLLGSLALFQYVVTNFILTFYFAKITVRLRSITLEDGPVKFAHVFTSLWFVPATPFAVCGLMYSDLYSITKFGEAKRPGDARLRDVVYVYNAQMSLPLLFFQNIYGVALVAAATAFHMPFLVVLFIAVWLFSIHFVYSCDAYITEYCRWRARGLSALSSFTRCGWLWLSPIMDFLLKKKKRSGKEEKEKYQDEVDAFGRQNGGEIVYANGSANHNFTSPSRSADRLGASVGGMSDRRRLSSAYNPQLPYPPDQQRGSGAYSDTTSAVNMADSNAFGDADDDGGPIHFPQMPPRHVDRRESTRPEDADMNQGIASSDDSSDESGNGGSLITISNQRADDRASSQFWPNSVAR